MQHQKTYIPVMMWHAITLEGHQREHCHQEEHEQCDCYHCCWQQQSVPPTSQAFHHQIHRSQQCQEQRCSFSVSFQLSPKLSCHISQDWKMRQARLIIKHNSSLKNSSWRSYATPVYLPIKAIILCCCLLFWRCFSASWATWMAAAKFASAPTSKPTPLHWCGSIVSKLWVPLLNKLWDSSAVRLNP